MICSRCLHEVPTTPSHVNRWHQDCDRRVKGDGSPRRLAGKWLLEPNEDMKQRIFAKQQKASL
jgi:hypothetical protein